MKRNQKNSRTLMQIIQKTGLLVHFDKYELLDYVVALDLRDYIIWIFKSIEKEEVYGFLKGLKIGRAL